MRRTEELIRVDSCLNKAHDDEPIFVLRANDELAPAAVRRWAFEYFLSKDKGQNLLTDKQRAKYEEALKLADEMEEWRQTRAAK